MTGLALYFLQPTGWTLFVPVTGAPASTLSPMPRQENWSSVVEKTHSFWRLAVTPTLSCGQERHLDAELPTDATELESTKRRCSSFMRIPWRRRSTRENEKRKPKKTNLRNFLWYGRMDVEVCVLEIYRDKPVLGSDLWHDLSHS